MKFQMGLSEFEVEELEDNIENPRCMMDIFEGPARKNKVELNEKGIEIGRDSNNSLAVCEDSQMSNFHAKIMYENNKFMLKDEGSTNK
jgi:pSer/pThr/pTyr-binding forkhead associated (FHA) protein